MCREHVWGRVNALVGYRTLGTGFVFGLLREIVPAGISRRGGLGEHTVKRLDLEQHTVIAFATDGLIPGDVD